MNREELSTEEKDLLMWAYIDGTISDTDLGIFNRLKQADQSFARELESIQLIHADLQNMPLSELTVAAQQSLEASLLPKQTSTVNIKLYQILVLFLIASGLFIYGMIQMDQLIPTEAVDINSFAFNFNALNNVNLEWNSTFITWANDIEIQNGWIYFTFFLVAPLIYIMDKLIQSRVKIHTFSFL